MKNEMKAKIQAEKERSSRTLKYIQFPVTTDQGVVTINKRRADSSFPLELNGEEIGRISASFDETGVVINAPIEVEIREIELSKSFRIQSNGMGGYVGGSDFWGDVRTLVDMDNVFVLPNCMDQLTIKLYAERLFNELPVHAQEEMNEASRKAQIEAEEEYSSWQKMHNL